ncbi:hypothetical protein C0992_012963, partial [Termitomyces sp. T32_za158]
MFLQTYKALKDDREALEEDEEMISPTQICTLFVDWTDPHKLRTIVCVINTPSSSTLTINTADSDAHGKLDSEHQEIMSIQLDMAEKVLRSLLEENWG